MTDGLYNAIAEITAPRLYKYICFCNDEVRKDFFSHEWNDITSDRAKCKKCKCSICLNVHVSPKLEITYQVRFYTPSYISYTFNILSCDSVSDLATIKDIIE
jgi:hypothetical protein